MRSPKLAFPAVTVSYLESWRHPWVSAVCSSSANLSASHLNTVQGNVEYHFGNCYTVTGAFFNITGTNNLVLYAPAPVSGGASGSRGHITEVNWWPQQNIKFGVQYTGYTRFNGAGTNYDRSGRNASYNNSLYLIGYFTF
jgi:hypothetical protein